VTATLCAATFSNSYVKWRKRCVILRFVAVPFFYLFDSRQLYRYWSPLNSFLGGFGFLNIFSRLQIFQKCCLAECALQLLNNHKVTSSTDMSRGYKKMSSILADQ
jgi:hypothetical protein